jgi:broad specificity phosphatase PhoE
MEDYGLLTDRIMNGIHSLTSAALDRQILLVSHGAVINALFKKLSGNTSAVGKTFLKNACISMLTYQPKTDALLVQTYNLSPEEYLAAHST